MVNELSMRVGEFRGGVRAAPIRFQPPGYQLKVYATNPSDSTDNGYAWVTLVGILGGGEYLMSLNPGQSAQFYSSLGGVTYSLEPQLGSITTTGLYTHNATSYTAGTIVKVTATSTSNANQQQTGHVKLQ